jgi:HK97 family phage major capsid protein
MGNETDSMIYFGDAVKALGDGKVAGYLVRYSGANDPDLTDDFFTKETEYGVVDGSNLPVFYQHGMDEKMGVKSIGRGTIKIDDIGLWIEAQLNMRSEYEQAIYQLAKDGKLGWSSQAAGTLVSRESIGKSYNIKSWPIAEASLTPTPAEPRNNVIPIKSLITTLPVDTGGKEKLIVNESEVKMTEEELKAMQDSIAEVAASVKALVAANEPEVKAGYQVDVIEDEADKAAKLNPFKSAGEFFTAVKRAGTGGETDKRLLAMKAAAGANESTPSEGGFLVQQDIASNILEKTWSTGSVLSRFNAMPVQGNGMKINVIDETSRADGYRGGGILGYWLAEAGEKTATKTKLRQISLDLKKVAALCYATDELLEDASALESWITTNVPQELRFQVEAAIVNGNGVGKPLGILQSPAFYAIERQTAGAFIDATDLGNMWAHRYTGANDYVWFVSSTIFPQLMNLTVGTTPAYMPPGGLSGSPYGTIFGRPVVETEYNPSLGTAGDILLAAPSQYALIAKGGIKSASSIHVKFTTDETAFRFVYRVDGEPTWNDKVSSYYASSDYVSPFVGLLATS